jgi:hypothetical protein
MLFFDNKLGFSGVFAQHQSDCFRPPFSKGGALRVAEPRGLSALGVSFWELFLCAYCAKEKVDKR